MEPNALDKLFKSQLKGQEEVPAGVEFNSERCYQSLQKRMDTKTPLKSRMMYAVIIFLFLISGYAHWYQQGIIKKQYAELSRTEHDLKTHVANAQNQLQAKQNEIDSLTKSRKLKPKATLPKLKPIQPMLAQYKIVMAKTAVIQVQKLEPLAKNEISNQNKSYVPELDLPVYYESERLADNTTCSTKGQSLSDKLGNLINNN